MNYPLLVKMWQLASEDLGIQVVAPFSLILSSGNQIKVALLVRNFGANKGMLIVGKNSEINPYTDELIREGYGYSVLGDPRAGEQYSKEVFIELLREWEWTGTETQKPVWL